MNTLSVDNITYTLHYSIHIVYTQIRTCFGLLSASLLASASCSMMMPRFRMFWMSRRSFPVWQTTQVSRSNLDLLSTTMIRRNITTKLGDVSGLWCQHLQPAKRLRHCFLDCSRIGLLTSKLRSSSRHVLPSSWRARLAPCSPKPSSWLEWQRTNALAQANGVVSHTCSCMLAVFNR